MQFFPVSDTHILDEMREFCSKSGPSLESGCKQWFLHTLLFHIGVSPKDSHLYDLGGV